MTRVLETGAPPATSMAATDSSSAFERWNIVAGNLFFRYRNALFPVVIAFVTLVTRPRILFGNLTIDHLLVGCGSAVALFGQLVRLVTIGFQYIDRGGKNRRVYASRIVQRGVYGLTRNPMYVGNTLIAIGLTMIIGAPLAYFVVIPFFLFVYQAIIAAEEAYLQQQFGQEYADYCARVPRFMPSFRNWPEAFAGMPYHWKRAIRQDLSTVIGTFTGLVLFPLWRTLRLYGWDAAFVDLPQAILSMSAVGFLYAFLLWLKKCGSLADD